MQTARKKCYRGFRTDPGMWLIGVSGKKTCCCLRGPVHVTITEIKKNSTDPISEIYDINLFLIKFLKRESASPLYQLQKYYPIVHKEINRKQFDFITKSTTRSLKNGIELGLFRKDIKIDFISRLYFKGMIGIRDLETFPTKTYNPVKLQTDFIEYHLRAIVTEKGLKNLNQFIKNN